MKKISINEALCVKCGICTRVCPVSIISYTGEAWPSIEESKNGLCINCGHCEAYCPKKALSLSYNFETENIPDLSKASVSPDDLEQHFKNRRSVRSFKSAPVKKDFIEKAVDISRYAPTGKNYQNVSWSVIYNKSQMDTLIDLFYTWMITLPESDSPFKKAVPVKTALKLRNAGTEMILRGAPHCAVSHAPLNGPMGKAAAADALIAMSHFDLALPSFGLGGFWAGFLTMGLMDSSEIRKHCMIPDSHIVGYAYGFGTPLYQTYSIPKRMKAKIEWI